MSARIRSGLSRAARATASVRVRAMPVTLWPIWVTISTMSIAMIASSSITMTRPATDCSISSIATETRWAASSVSICMIEAISSKRKRSIVFSRSASRELGVRPAICACARAERRESGIADRRARTGPDKVEGMEKRNLRVFGCGQGSVVDKQRLKRGSGIAISGFLVSRQCPGVATQVGKGGTNGCGKIGLVGRRHQCDSTVRLLGTKRAVRTFGSM